MASLLSCVWRCPRGLLATASGFGNLPLPSLGSVGAPQLRAAASTIADREFVSSGKGEDYFDSDVTDYELRKDKRFIDRRRVVITSGDGGAGAVSFRMDGGSKMRRGADGGNGGDGADVWIHAVRHVKGLGDVPFRLVGPNGGRGGKEGSQGKRGKNIELRVPVGTVIWKELLKEQKDDDFDENEIDFSSWGTSTPVSQDDEENEEDEVANEPNLGTRPRGIHKGEWVILADLNKHGSKIRIAKGGRGGRGNKTMPKGPSAGTSEPGGKGEDATIVLELKSVADIGLVGFPNAGKSTLLRAISSAQPKVAEYAFTTISPQLGAVSTDGGISSFVVADIPGLIEGAHENRGLGHNFLRHVERCAAFVYVVDLGAGAGGRPGVRPWNALQTLMAELEAYLPGLSARPAIVVGTKADLPHSSRAAETLRRRTTLPVVMVSAHESRGIQDMLSKADELLHQTQRGKDAYEY